jgi:hypothetical protein
MRIGERDQFQELAGENVTYTVSFVVFIQSIDNKVDVGELFDDLFETLG